MAEKVAVTLMKRRKVDERCSVFTVTGTKMGYYDQDFMLFYDDESGACYQNVRTVATSRRDNILAFDNLIKVETLMQGALDGDTLSGAIKRYEAECRKHFYFVVTNEKKDASILTFDVKMLEALADKVRYGNVELGGRLKHGKNIGKNKTGNEDKDDSLNIQKLVSLFGDAIVDGSRTTDDLKTLKNMFIYYQAELKNLLNLTEFELSEKEKNQGKNADHKQKRTSKKVNDSDSINIDEVSKLITKSVIHQDSAVYRLVTEIERNLGTDYDRDGILITGSTGVGKTLTINLIAEYLDRPVKIIDSTQLTVPGYVGKNVEDFLGELLVDCDGDIKKAENAIIFFDEIDKKGSEKKSDISGQGVLNVLLKFLDGTTYDVNLGIGRQIQKVKMSTKNMLVIAGGSFADVYKRKIDRPIGFDSSKDSEEYVPTATDFVEKGMMTKDFMGRFPIVIHYDDLDTKALVDLLTNSSISPLKREKETFRKAGVKLTVTEGYKEAVARAACDLETGARGLKGIVKNTTWRCYSQVKSEAGKYSEVILDERAVADDKAYKLVKKTTK